MRLTSNIAIINNISRHVSFSKTSELMSERIAPKSDNKLAVSPDNLSEDGQWLSSR